MGEASASAATGIDNSGAGNLTVNQPNYLAWIMAGIGMVLLAFIFKRKKKKH